MRLFSLLLAVLFATTLAAQNVNVTFKSKLTYNNQVLANLWGYSDGTNEYALVGAEDGLSIVDVTDPLAPVEISLIAGNSSDWREVRTYQNYCYSVSEGGGGVLIVDLSGLPAAPPASAYHNYTGDGAIAGLLQKAHALDVDETEGYLYVYGSHLSNNSNQGKPLIFDLADPENPVYVGVYTAPFASKYVHDGYAENDYMYSAHINAGTVAIVDMSDKSNPVTLETFTTPGLFTHNTWLNGTTLFTTDEVTNSYLTAYDISDLNNIVEKDRIQSNPGSGSIVHNTHIHNDFAITSWYKDGFTIVDVSRPANLIQVGNYDTYPNGAGNGFEGCWGVYPYLPSGNIIASNIRASSTNNGELFIIDPDYVRACYLEGKITKAANGQALQGALVEILTTQASQSSGSDGLYKTGYHQSGDYTVRVSRFGYQTWTGTVTLTNGVVTVLDVALQIPSAVEMLRFDVSEQGEAGALLTWATATERDNKGFEIQHSTGSMGNWQNIGFVTGKGDSGIPAEYQFTAENLKPGKHFFRLRQIDFDGRDNYTDARVLELKNRNFRAEMLPNIASDRCALHIFSAKPQQVRVEILDAGGYRMGLSWDLSVEGEIVIPVGAAQLPAGGYFAYIITEFGDDVVLRWVKE